MKFTQEQVDQIKRASEEYTDDIVAFLRDLIAIPSFSSQEGGCIKRIKEEMEKVGFSDVRIDAIGNVIGTMGTGPKKILYDSHIDTVAIADPTAWKYDPFKGEYKDGIIYGRGASDNKAAMACMVYAGKIICELGLLPEDVTLYVTGVVQEEDCDGWAV